MTLQQYEKIRWVWYVRMKRLLAYAGNFSKGIPKQKQAMGLYMDMSFRLMIMDNWRETIIRETKTPDYWIGLKKHDKPMFIRDMPKGDNVSSNTKELEFKKGIEKLLLDSGIHASSGCRNSITDFKKGCDGK